MSSETLPQLQASPLSFAQQRLWFLEQLEPGSPRYNIPRVVRFRGALDVPALKESLNTIVARHETLRCRFVSLDGEPMMIADEEASIALELKDLASDADLAQVIRAEVNRPFNLAAEHLLRATLLRLAPEDHVLIVNMHHIVSDEWSYGVFFSELAALYKSVVQGQPRVLPELPIQYSDYALWQRESLDIFKDQLQFWTERLRDRPAPTELPADRPRQADSTARAAGCWRLVSRQLSDAVAQLAATRKASLFMFLLTAFKVLLHRYTQQEDIIVGSPLSGRTRLETEPLIGFFVNTMPLRTRVHGDENFLELLDRVREVVLGAFSNQDLPFDKLVEVLQPEREPHRMPFMRVLFLVSERAPGESDLSFPGLDVEFLDIGTDAAKFDVTFGVQETASGLQIAAEYDADLFEPETVARLLEHYEVLLNGIIAQPTQPVSHLPLLTESERHQLFVEWNATTTEYPRGRCVHEIFEEQAGLRPDAVAVVFGQNRLTYQELNLRANQVAHYLRGAGVGPGAIVGLFLERSLELPVVILGILKAGAAYAPLDPESPQDRLRFMLEDLQPQILITTEAGARIFQSAGKTEQEHPVEARGSESAGRPQLTSGDLSARPHSGVAGDRKVRAPGTRVLCLDSARKALAKEQATNLCYETGPESLAYICFTSGSTGRPKGVCVPHRGVVRLVCDTKWLSFSPNEVFLQLASISFDAAVFELWGALLNGGRLMIAPPHLPSLSELTTLIHREGVTTAWFTTGLFNQVVEEAPQALAGLRQAVTGGDVASPAHIKKALGLLEQGRLINGYGPTENATFSTAYTVPRDYDATRPVPIGRPISNSECYILDRYQQPVPIGVPGELYVGGDALALGYLNRPELTAEKFVSHPFEPGRRLYKTGDLARYLSDGNIEFLGRLDSQVKIRGFRVELGEIEARLQQHPHVRQCVVTAQPDPTGTKRLVAYIVLSGSGDPKPLAPHRSPQALPPSSLDPQPFQTFLRQSLPEYMVPAFFVALSELPLSRNGKVDRRALPAPEVSGAMANGHAGPKDEIEQQLQDLWERVLEVRPIGIRDKFFALGGHSLLAVRLVARVEKVFGKKLPVASVFQYPTVEQFATLLRNGHSRGSNSIVEIQAHGSKPPLLLVHGAGGGMFWGYNNLARHLGPDQPLFAFKSRGLDGLDELETIDALAEAYLTDLRAFQPHGPYYLGGYCFGGVVAYEMACRLHAQGEKIGLLALINSSPPNSSYQRFRWTPRLAVKWLKNFCLRTRHFVLSSQLPGYLRWRKRLLLERLRRARTVPASAEPDFLSCRPAGRSSATRPPADEADEWLDLSQYPADQQRLWRTHVRALAAYHPPMYPGSATLFRSALHLLYCSFDFAYGWGDVVRGGVSVKIVPGAHDTIMEEPRISRLADALRGCLA